MNPFPLSQLRSVVGGKPLTPMPEGNVFIRSVCTDSRRLETACLFVAVKGERHDGHDYVPALRGAPEQGPVVAALVERECHAYPPGVYVLQVGSTRAAMGKLATHVRRSFTGHVIAVGGSNGKTSTKHLIDAALRCKLRGSISPKSYNNDIGVPLTIFNHDPLADYLVLEMGTNHHGELKVLSEMALPDVAVITSISHEHLEGLGDLGGVRREEASIVAGLSSKGLLVVNGDDPELMPHLQPFVSRGASRVVTFGFGEHNDLFASAIRVTADGTRFLLNASRREVFVPMLGRHTASNALAAIAVARRLGLGEDEVIAALAEARGPEMRQQLMQVGGVTVLNDAYNANPASVRSALDTFLTLPVPAGGRRVAVLGEMRELGEASAALHAEVGRLVATMPLDVVVGVGEGARGLLDAAVSAGLPAGRAAWFADSVAAGQYVREWVVPADVVLLKGSRGVRLEAVLAAMAGRSAAAETRRVG
ncbi:MAG: UDP-N-acetylmuramoyl-tripeptide--D-alanyl-D-alanine ligase [Tepidisphaerales bacterium]